MKRVITLTERDLTRIVKRVISEAKTGCIKGNCENGIGTYVHDNGTYVGPWKNGEKNGKGTYSWNDGTKYYGDFVNGDIKGKGVYTFPDGSKYEGDYVDNNYNGQGTFTYANGTKYVGGWKAGFKNGYGVYINKWGNEFKGNWIDGKLDGKYSWDLDDIKVEKFNPQFQQMKKDLSAKRTSLTNPGLTNPFATNQQSKYSLK